MPRFCLPLSLLVVAGTAGAREILPSYLTNMESQAQIPLEPLQGRAREHGFDCLGMRLFTYRNASSATASVNSWLQAQGMRAQTVSEAPGEVQWKASSGSGTDLYAMWQSTPEGGRLWMCSGSDQTSAAQAGSAPQTTPQPLTNVPQADEPAHDEPAQTHRRVRIPLWAIALLGSGLAGGISRSIARNPFEPDR